MKKCVVLFVTAILSFCCILPISAFAENSQHDQVEVTSVQPRTEEKVWKFRENNGYLEKRLWSITYGKWLTDWIIVGPLP